MPEKNLKQEPRQKKIDEIRNYFIRNQNRLLSKKHKKFVEFSTILTTYLF